MSRPLASAGGGVSLTSQGLVLEIYAVINRKGGVGKTTLAVNLAAGLALKGHRTLLVDVDREGGSTKWLRVKSGDVGSFLYYGREFNDCAVRVRPNFFVLKSPTVLTGASGFAMRMVTVTARERLKSVANDYCIIDCAPGENVFNTNALTIADGLIIPVVPEYLSLRSLDDLLAEIKEVKQIVGETSIAEIKCVVPTAYNGRHELHRDHLKALQQMGLPVAPPVRYNERFLEAARDGKTIYEQAPKGEGARDINAVIDFLLRDLELEIE